MWYSNSIASSSLGRIQVNESQIARSFFVWVYVCCVCVYTKVSSKMQGTKIYYEHFRIYGNIMFMSFCICIAYIDWSISSSDPIHNEVVYLGNVHCSVCARKKLIISLLWRTYVCMQMQSHIIECILEKLLKHLQTERKKKEMQKLPHKYIRIWIWKHPPHV